MILILLTNAFSIQKKALKTADVVSKQMNKPIDLQLRIALPIMTVVTTNVSSVSQHSEIESKLWICHSDRLIYVFPDRGGEGKGKTTENFGQHTYFSPSMCSVSVSSQVVRSDRQLYKTVLIMTATSVHFARLSMHIFSDWMWHKLLYAV